MKVRKLQMRTNYHSTHSGCGASLQQRCGNAPEETPLPWYTHHSSPQPVTHAVWPVDISGAEKLQHIYNEDNCFSPVVSIHMPLIPSTHFSPVTNRPRYCSVSFIAVWLGCIIYLATMEKCRRMAVNCSAADDEVKHTEEEYNHLLFLVHLLVVVSVYWSHHHSWRGQVLASCQPGDSD